MQYFLISLYSLFKKYIFIRTQHNEQAGILIRHISVTRLPGSHLIGFLVIVVLVSMPRVLYR
jgi:hypothetical protein